MTKLVMLSMFAMRLRFELPLLYLLGHCSDPWANSLLRMSGRWGVGNRQGNTLACKGRGQRMAMEKHVTKKGMNNYRNQSIMRFIKWNEPIKHNPKTVNANGKTIKMPLSHSTTNPNLRHTTYTFMLFININVKTKNKVLRPTADLGGDLHVLTRLSCIGLWVIYIINSLFLQRYDFKE